MPLTAAIAPLRRLPPSIDTFTYRVPQRLAQQIRVGSVVVVTLHSRRQHGVVTSLEQSSSDATEKLKDILDSASPTLTPQQVTIARLLSSLYVQSIGLILHSFVATEPLRGSSHPDQRGASRAAIRGTAQASAAKQSAAGYCFYTSREALYKLLDEQAAARRHGEQLLIITPDLTIRESVRTWARAAVGSNGILDMPRRTNRVAYRAAWYASQTQSIIIGGLPSLFLPFNKLTRIIAVEAEHVLFQSAEQNPRYHLADILLPIADIHRASVLVAGYSPDVRLLWEMQKRKLPVRSLGERLPNPTLISLTKGSFQRATAVPHEVMTLLEDFPDKRILILYNRIGDIRTLQCRDCGALPSCPTCGKPYMVDSQRNTLVCMTDATERPMIAQCEQCHGVNLDTKGFGIERIAKEVRAAFPDRQVITFSRVSDNAQSARSKGDTSDTGGVIVIATTSILFTQQPSFDAVIWLKPETDLAHTSFHAAERVRHDIKKLQADHTNLTLITATPEHPAFTTLGSVPDFFQNEIIWRKKFSYAPFGTLYKGIIVAPSEADARRLAARITAPLKQYSMLGPHGKASKGRFRLTFSYKAKTEAERTALDAAFRGSYNGFHLEINPYSLD